MATPRRTIESPLVDLLRGDELASIRSEVQAGRRDHILKSLDERGRAQELVRQQYSGRYSFELLQNANDAAADIGAAGRARFVLTEDALIVADNGTGFGGDQIRAICGFGRSSKDPRKSVGYKGLGFKSVGEITSRPQIVSTGVSFEFDELRVRDAVTEAAGPLEYGQRLPIYAFPFGVDDGILGRDVSVIDEARADGFTTVLRLPLRAGVERAEVEAHLVESLVPRLLLFLTGIEELELQGTLGDFVSVIGREQHQDHDEILLDTNGTIEHWLVYRRWHDVHQDLVTPIGDAWAQIERVHVAVAVPLDEAGRPRSKTLFPLHVYFPTEEATGLPLILHGDFALQLDRRQLSVSPEATPYNEWLLDVAAKFLGDEVAPSLAQRYPGEIAAAAAVTPRSPGTGMGRKCVDRCIEALRMSRFLPAIDGGLRIPAEALLLPSSVGEAARAHGHLDLSEMGRLMIPATESDPSVRAFLKDQLGVEEWPLDEALARLKFPLFEARTGFYEMLVDWAERAGSRAFASRLARVPCIVTATGEWIAPADGRVFFPRQRDDVRIPSDLPVPIADVPVVDGLAALLVAAGVREFEWRELMRDYLLPLLTSHDTLPALRERAMRGLNAYYVSQRAGDPVLQRRIREVLLPAATADSVHFDLKPAGELYFPSAWTGTKALELLYGPFGKSEFLATIVPADSDERSAEAAFFRWMGVAGHPRVQEARTDQRDIFMTGWLGRHPHKVPERAWREWWDSPEVRESTRCPQDHPSSQQLRASFVLDRFLDLAQTDDVARLFVLWTELAENWGSVYEPATRAVFHCQHSAHGGNRDRAAPSLLWHQLTRVHWVPARRSDEIERVRPSDAWRVALDTPKWVARRVPRLDQRLLGGPGLQLAMILGVTDAARPEPEDLRALLEDLRTEYERSGEATKEIHIAARWAMRTLNDVLMDEPKGAQIRGVPLLARYQGAHVFTAQPVVAIDPLLAETWEKHYPILDADRDLRRLHEALNLVILDDPERGVQVVPVPQGVRPDFQEVVERLLGKAKPYLAAVAVANTPSREDEVLRGLKRLEVTACSELILRYSFDGRTIDLGEATSYIAVRQESVRGAVRRNIGTAHLEIDPESGHPDWYSFGPQLAQFLQVPTQGDAFAVLLAGTDADRRRYLASRRVPLKLVDEMRVALNLPVDDELPGGLFEFLGEQRNTSTTGFDTAVGIDSEAEQSEIGTGPSGDAPSTDEPLPPIDLEAVTIEDVAAGEIEPLRPGTGGGVGLGPTGPIDHERVDRRQREIGQRGEVAALEAERRRVQAVGLDPSAVVWRSERNPLAPYDIESLDVDGQRIFIEVKATTSEHPSEPFVISQSELLQALRHRSRFYIYRVTRAHTAAPVVLRYQDPARLLAEGKADLHLSDARMRLGSDAGSE